MTDPKQLAREMAERCAAKLHYDFSREWFNSLSAENDAARYKTYEALFQTAEEERLKITLAILSELNLEQLIADKQRLDWLEEHISTQHCRMITNNFPPVRTAIDEAMKGQP